MSETLKSCKCVFKQFEEINGLVKIICYSFSEVDELKKNGEIKTPPKK